MFNDSNLRMRPSEYFQRQCWISFEPVEGSLSHLADYLGPTKSCGRPTIRTRMDFSGAPAMIAEKLPKKNKRKVLAESAMQFYKLS
jgi:hypothetical protein